MVRTLLSRIKRLENIEDSQKSEVHFVSMQNGESSSQALERYCSENPQAKDCDIYFVTNIWTDVSDDSKKSS